MKKNFIYSALTLIMCLFAACSQEEIISESGQGGKVVKMTIGVPGGATTRAIPSVEGAKLRCIMQVVNTSNAAIEGEGMRQVQEVTADKITFTFTAPEEEYKCLFWADFVSDVNTDNIYNTTNLANITYNKTDNAVFSAAADAFCGVVANGASTILLKRPFTKVSVAPNNAGSFSDYKALAVSYDAPSGFNMVTKAVGNTAQRVTFTNGAFNAASGAWFSSFIFAPANVDKLNSAITMQLSGGTGGNKTLTIEAGKVPLTENYDVNGKFDAAEGSSSTSVEVSFDDEFDKPEVKAPVVGDYFYADGTWGANETSTSGSTAIGIVFDLATDDVIENYNGDFSGKTIKGWVIALSDNTNAKSSWIENGTLVAITDVQMPSSIEVAANELKGYANTKGITTNGTTEISGATFPAHAVCTGWEPKNPNGTSGWYMPSSGQLKRLHTAWTNTNNLKSVLNGTYLSSSLYDAKANGIVPLGVLFDVSNEAQNGVIRAQKATSQYLTRPILTFFE